ncbi:MAG TPA: amino acid ABC transporter permease [Casimicrobiaceae bacterium]|nr:amino acid ABC transporter permease [Casimicrobiaceae bacterium]
MKDHRACGAHAANVLAVLLPAAERMTCRALRDREAGSQTLRLESSHGVVLLVAFLCGCGIAQAQSQVSDPSIFTTLWKWTPLLARGFVFNLAISFLAMAIGTIAGLFLGFAQISLLLPVKKGAFLATHFFRNAPWLVLLFYCMFLLPFQVTVFGVTIPVPDWTKATLGLALPVMANVSEIVRGAIQSIPTTQWEAAASLAFNRRQTLWMIIFPQCIKRMLPPWMNLYAILTMATVLASIVGVNEMMTLTQRALSAESRPGLLLAFYSYVLLWFFLYCYPIARWTVRLEARYAVNQ